MPTLEPSPLLASQVLQIAHAAGAAILGIYRPMCEPQGNTAPTGLTYKADHSPLTLADMLAHRVIAQQLKALTPHITVVSEEDELSWQKRQARGDFWLVDPLDGTKEFLARTGEFTVNIALVRNGRPVLGVVAAPALGQSYWGGRSMGAFREQGGRVQPIHVAPRMGSSRTLRVVASKSHLNEATRAFIAQLGPCELVQAGSSLKFCLVAQGDADVYPRLGPTCEWDTAAAQAIVEAAGGHVSELNADPLHYGKPNVLNPYFVASRLPWLELQATLALTTPA